MPDRLTLVDPCTLAKIGAEIECRLKLAFPPEKFQQDWMPARPSQQQWTDILRRTPFIGVGWSDIEDNQAQRAFAGQASFSVFLVTRNQAGLRQRYFGDRLGPGLLAMSAAAIGILHGHSVPEVGALRVQKAANVLAEDWRDDQAVMAALDVVCNITLPLGDVVAGVEIDALNTRGVEWSFGGPDAPVALSDRIAVEST